MSFPAFHNDGAFPFVPPGAEPLRNFVIGVSDHSVEYHNIATGESVEIISGLSLDQTAKVAGAIYNLFWYFID